MFGIPILGLILLIAGLRQRSRARQLPPGYPPPGPYPYGHPPPSAPVDTGYPYQPGPPAPPTPPQYYPTGYPAPRPTPSGIALIVVGSILLGLGVLGILGRSADVVSRRGSSAHSPDVGQCIGQHNFQEKNSNPAPQDCAKPDSIFEVATKGGASANCPDGKLEDSDYAVFRDGTTTLCLMLNFTQGQCYTASGEAKNPIFAATACDGSLPRFQVVKRIDGSSDEALCPAGTKAISYPVPARLYCLESLKS